MTSIAEINNVKQYSLISGVIVEKSSVFSSEQLLISYFDFVGLKANETNLIAIIKGISNYYVDNGYFSPQVSIESHSEFNNIFIVKIAEPTLASFSISGGRSDTRAKASSYLNALVGSKLVGENTISYLDSSLENRIGVGVELSHTEIKGQAGKFDIAVKLIGDIKSLVTLSNSGADSLGRESLFAEIQFIEQISGFNNIYLNIFGSLEGDAYRSMGAGFNYELNSKNELSFAINNSQVHYEQDDLINDTEFDQKNVSLAWQRELGDADNIAKYLFANFSKRELERKNVSNDFQETLNFLEFGYWQQALSIKQSNYWRLTFAKGFDSMGAELNGVTNNPEAELDFSRYGIDLVYDLQLTSNTSLRLNLSGQYSQDYLPFSQRFSVASNSIASAYQYGEWSGDSGAGFKLELARGVNLSLLSSRWVPYVYYGAGKVRDNFRTDSTSVGSVGLGVRWFNKAMSLYCELGKPLIEDSIYRDSNIRVDAGLTFWF